MRCDLHLHSKHSRRRPEWLLRKIHFPDSASEPLRLYRTLKRKGMDLITLTDHNEISGCLEIADQPDVFISEEITTFFPGDHCQIHILAWNISEAQHRDIQSARENIYDLKELLTREQIVHSVAHPLRSYDAHFGSRHFEILLLLFKNFETINGLNDGLYSEVLQEILAALTPEIIERLANTHGITPSHPDPHVKNHTAGSNDHANLKAGCAWTETPGAGTPSELMARIESGEATVHGSTGSPVSASHGLYKTASSYLQEALRKVNSPAATLAKTVSQRFLAGENPTALGFRDKVRLLTDSVRTGKLFDFAKTGNSPILKEIRKTLTKREFQTLVAEELEKEKLPERRAFAITNLMIDQIAFHLIEKTIRDVSRGRIMESLELIGSMAPLVLALSPYFYCFHSQTASQSRLRSIAEKVVNKIPSPLRNDRRVWFTDTLYDINGVAMTVRKMAAEAGKAGHQLSVVTCATDPEALPDIDIKNFHPIGEFELPEYEVQKVAFPPLLQVLDYIQSRGFNEVILSTPGPLGICGLIAAKLLGLRAVSIYHTDFPKYVNILTDDSFLETVTWRSMLWFYNQCDLVYVNSRHYRDIWVERGIRPEKLSILPRGMDTEFFHPRKKIAALWQDLGADEGERIVLYAGRVSREKDLHLLIEADRRLRAAGHRFRIAVVGDGPFLDDLKKAIPTALFTGYRKGEALAEAYASSDLFAFPSTTDTYGNVVVEAMASGLPCVVSDVGGPRDLVKDGVNGFITRGLDAESFTAGISRLLRNPDDLDSMKDAARQTVAKRTWSKAMEQFWEMSRSRP